MLDRLAWGQRCNLLGVRFGCTLGLLNLKLGIRYSLTLGFLDLPSRGFGLLLRKSDLMPRFVQFLFCLFCNLTPRFLELLFGQFGELLLCLGRLSCALFFKLPAKICGFAGGLFLGFASRIVRLGAGLLCC